MNHNIPKIIHHIAPKDRERWHPLWDKCYPSWKTCFPEFRHILWNDEEDIDNLVKDKFPEYLELYQSFPVHIMKIDFARLCMLYEYGGMYVDMDVYCYRNFYNELVEDLYIMEAPYGTEPLENALMICTKNHWFNKKCMEKCLERFEYISKQNIPIPFNSDKDKQYYIGATAGPNLICTVFKENGLSGRNVLPGQIFNNHGMSYHEAFRTKHLLTGLWGKEAIDELDKQSKGKYKTSLKKWYIDEVSKYAYMPENITLDEFSVYTDYTNGQFLKESRFDINRTTNMYERE